MKSKAVFLDRDNTLIYDNGYTFKNEDLRWMPDTISTLKYFFSQGYKLFVITNQSGVARGYYTEDDVNHFHEYMNEALFEESSITIEKFYYCPHHEDGKIARYTKKCECRKPSNQLFLQAINEFSINPQKSIVIGDNITDLIPAFELDVNKGYLITKKYHGVNNFKNKYPTKTIICVDNWNQVVNN